MSNPLRKPGEDELGISRARNELPGDISKKSSHGDDPLKRKSKELGPDRGHSEAKENINPNPKRRRLEGNQSPDRIYSKEFEDVQDRLSSNRARLDSIKKADSGYSDDFYTNVGIIFKLGKEAKKGLKYIDKHRKLPPPTAE